ncbi:MAG: hypothetical protein M3393_07585 [Actinomycetota bacterium]|nr:hypothetical protein [Actinomycetota bacterium]
MASDRVVFVPPERLTRWFDNFAVRHGDYTLESADGLVQASAEDGTRVIGELPFARTYDGPPDVSAFAEAAQVPLDWGVLLVRKGGFAVARLDGREMVASKVGQRHVQGRSKAGGQSQQRFARRRENQAREAFAAAADHAHRILLGGSGRIAALVCGGDRTAIEEVLANTRLRTLADVRTGPWLAVADPRRSILEHAVVNARSARLVVPDER